MQLARDWVTLGKRLWTVSIDTRNGARLTRGFPRAAGGQVQARLTWGDRKIS